MTFEYKTDLFCLSCISWDVYDAILIPNNTQNVEHRKEWYTTIM